MAHRSPFFALLAALAVLLGAHMAQASAGVPGRVPMKTQRYFSERFPEGEAKAMEAYTVSMTSAVPAPRKLSDSSDSDAPVSVPTHATPSLRPLPVLSCPAAHIYSRSTPPTAFGPPPPPPRRSQPAAAPTSPAPTHAPRLHTIPWRSSNTVSEGAKQHMREHATTRTQHECPNILRAVMPAPQCEHNRAPFPPTSPTVLRLRPTASLLPPSTRKWQRRGFRGPPLKIKSK